MELWIEQVPDGTRLEAVAQRLLGLALAEALDVAASELADVEWFGELGLTSLQVLNIVAALGRDLGELPLTLLFEYPTPEGVVEYLLAHRRDGLARLCEEGAR